MFLLLLFALNWGSWSTFPSFRSFSTVLGATLLTVFYSCGIECTTDDVISHTRKILHTTTSDQYDRVLLQIVTFTWNVSVHFFPVRQSYPRHLSHRGVRFFRGCSVYSGTNSSTLWTCVQGTRL